jgi:hypothetical protein
MAHTLKPVIGEWYLPLDKDQSFRVVSVDREEELVEIQHFDGDVEELGLAEWFAMDLERAAQPEDWTGPMDDIEKDDLGDTDSTTSDKDWRASVDSGSPLAQEWQAGAVDDERPEPDEDPLADESTDAEP